MTLCTTAHSKRGQETTSIVIILGIISVSILSFFLIGQYVFGSKGFLDFIKTVIFQSNPNDSGTNIYTLVDATLCLLATTWVLSNMIHRIKIQYCLLLSCLFSALIFPFCMHILPGKLNFNNYPFVFFIICLSSMTATLIFKTKNKLEFSQTMYNSKLHTLGLSLILLCFYGLVSELNFLKENKFKLDLTLICLASSIASILFFRRVSGARINLQTSLITLIISMICLSSCSYAGNITAILIGIVTPPLSIVIIDSFKSLKKTSSLTTILILGTTGGLALCIGLRPLSVFPTLFNTGAIFALCYLMTSLSLMMITLNTKQPTIENDEDNLIDSNSYPEVEVIDEFKQKIKKFFNENKPNDNFLVKKEKTIMIKMKKKLKGSRAKRKKIKNKGQTHE